MFDRFVKDLNPDIVLPDRFMIEEQLDGESQKVRSISEFGYRGPHFTQARSLSIKDGKDALTECYPVQRMKVWSEKLLVLSDVIFRL